MRTLITLFSYAATMVWLATTLTAGDLQKREGWAVHTTQKSYEQLLGDTRAAIKANKMGLVTEAGPTKVAASRGITIPGNRTIGVFNNDFAVQILALSTAAMIEAPVRLYVTENADGTGTLAYKTPSHVFAPYVAEAGSNLADLAAELDTRFATIAASATQ